MKPAKDWVKEAGSREEFYGGRYHEDNILDLGVVEQIQLDAVKEGYRRAAMECHNSLQGQGPYFKTLLLSRSERLTEKDL